MKKISLILIFILVASCAPKTYIYKLQLKKPVVSNELKFNDEKLSIEFTFKTSEVAFNIKNNSDKPLKVIWDEASFVYNGEAQKIMHKNVKFVDKEKTQAPTVIPPKSFISDLIQPIDDVKFNQTTYGGRSYSYWSSKPIFPIISYFDPKDKKRVEKMKKTLGTSVNIFIPIQQDGKAFDYYFEMEVTDILYRKNRTQTESIF